MIGTSSVPLHALQRRVHSSQSGLRDHLLSIVEDSETVLSLLAFLPPELPCFANKRNGCWYLPPDQPHHACYFKSTDGHDRNLSFNYTSRLNLDTAVRASTFGACVIVDSTRQGKVFPDSMRNTIPIWCSVMSAIAALDGSDTDTVEEVASAVTFHDLPSTPPAQSERMRSHVIPALIASVPPAIKAVIRGRLGVAGTRKPLVPVWIHPDEEGVLEWSGVHAEAVLECLSCDGSSVDIGEALGLGSGRNQGIPGDEPRGEVSASSSSSVRDALSTLPFVPVLLLSCSGARQARHVSEQSWTYMQGAGDDEEAWARGLTPELFWRHRDRILDAWLDDDDGGAAGLEQAVDRVVLAEQRGSSAAASVAGDPAAGSTGIHGSHSEASDNSMVLSRVSGTALAISSGQRRGQPVAWEEWLAEKEWDGVIVISAEGDWDGGGPNQPSARGQETPPRHRILTINPNFSKRESRQSKSPKSSEASASAIANASTNWTQLVPAILSWYRDVSGEVKGRAGQGGADRAELRVLVVSSSGEEQHSLAALALLVILLQFYVVRDGGLVVRAARDAQVPVNSVFEGVQVPSVSAHSKITVRSVLAALQASCPICAAWHPPRRIIKEIQSIFLR